MIGQQGEPKGFENVIQREDDKKTTDIRHRCMSSLSPNTPHDCSEEDQSRDYYREGFKVEFSQERERDVSIVEFCCSLSDRYPPKQSRHHQKNARKPTSIGDHVTYFMSV